MVGDRDLSRELCCGAAGLGAVDPSDWAELVKISIYLGILISPN